MTCVKRGFYLISLLLCSFQRTIHPILPLAFILAVKYVVGGDEENRTPDPLLARQVLSQLSYAPIMLRLFLTRLIVAFARISVSISRCRFPDTFFIVCTNQLPSVQVYVQGLVGLSGLGPLTSRLSGVRSNQLSYRPISTKHDITPNPSLLAQ